MKPSTQDTILIGHLTPLKGYQHEIIPLTAVHVFYNEEEGEVELRVEATKTIVDHLAKAMVLSTDVRVCISDEPYMTWAGDWNHLGQSVFTFTLPTVNVEIEEGYLLLKCPIRIFKKMYILAERFGTVQEVNTVGNTIAESWIFPSTLDEQFIYLKSTDQHQTHACLVQLYAAPHKINTAAMMTIQDVPTLQDFHLNGKLTVHPNGSVTGTR